MTSTFSLKPHTLIATLLVASTASMAANAASEYGEFSGNLRIGAITSEDGAGVDTDGSAIGGKFGYISPSFGGLSAGATVYATQQLFNDEEDGFLGDNGDDYAVLGEAFVQAVFGNTTLKGGRFEFDSPYADTDDIRMIPNTFQGALLTNTDIPATTLYVAHLSKWAGVDVTPTKEKFVDINADKGLSLVGASYDGIEQVNLQAWYYQAKNSVDLSYFEASYATDLFEVAAQFGSQNDDTPGGGGATDGDVYGLAASINISDFTLSAAYNDVDGTVTNGFGGGPFFTSADDHTIDGTLDQSAVAVGAEYGGIEGLTLGVLNVEFDKGEDEINYYAAYEVNNSLSFELIHADMHKDGNNTRLVANMSF